MVDERIRADFLQRPGEAVLLNPTSEQAKLIYDTSTNLTPAQRLAQIDDLWEWENGIWGRTGFWASQSAGNGRVEGEGLPSPEIGGLLPVLEERE
jgi:hypothetical protein